MVLRSSENINYFTFLSIPDPLFYLFVILSYDANVWRWSEKALRREEQKSDSFAVLCRKLLRVARRYPSAESLIPSMAKRVQAVLKHGGAMTKYCADGRRQRTEAMQIW